MTKATDTGQPAERERRLEYRENWVEHCRRYGFGRTELGRRFHYNDELWELVGIDPAKYRYGMICGKVSTGELRGYSNSVAKAGRGTDRR